MRVFITSVSGYAGYYAALWLAGAGHRVTGLSRDPDRPRLRFLKVNEVAIATGDVGDIDRYKNHLEQSDVIIHAMLDKNRPVDTDRALFGALGKLRQHAGSRRRFIYTTGCSIYGKVDVHIMDESVEPNPEHALAFRRALEHEALELPLSVVVLRPGFMYGADGYNSQTSDWFEMAESGDAVYRGDREKGWSWIHINDLAEAYRLVTEADRRVDGELFCLADSHRPLCVDVMRACLAAAGYSGELRFDGPAQGHNASTWFDQNEFITSEKARRLLGWLPRHPGVLDTIDATYASWKAASG